MVEITLDQFRQITDGIKECQTEIATLRRENQMLFGFHNNDIVPFMRCINSKLDNFQCSEKETYEKAFASIKKEIKNNSGRIQDDERIEQYKVKLYKRFGWIVGIVSTILTGIVAAKTMGWF